MKVLIVNTSEKKGGAAVAASRLGESLIKNGIKTKMLVMEKESDSVFVTDTGSWLRKSWNFAWERFVIWCANLFSRKNLFTVSIANTGFDITQLPEFQEADIVHLHWVNQGMLSLRGLRKILRSGKPVVWTMHDMWELTGICHHAYECTHYEQHCHHCRFLRFPHARDLAYRVFSRKQTALQQSKSPVHLVAVSHWLAGLAGRSALTGHLPVSVIGNPLSLSKFVMRDRLESRHRLQISGRKKVVVFGAARVDEPIKGFAYLREALRLVVERGRYHCDDLLLLVFGGCRDEHLFDDVPVPVCYMGRVSDERQMSELYSAADVVVSSSCYETFGQTLTEAQACGCVPVAFGNSGQADIIVHRQTGYLADYLSAEDLANGLEWAFEAGLKREDLRKHVAQRFAEDVIGRRYAELYAGMCGAD